MRALVTGSAGFVGRHFAAQLELDGWTVTRCDPKHDPGLAAIDCRHLFDAVGKHGPLTWDLVIHCAALVDGRETIDNKAAKIGAYNLMLDAALFDWALRARPGRIVYFSSSAAYPVRLQRPPYRARLCEQYITTDGGVPDQTYGLVKLSGERIATEVRKAGVPVTIVRPFSGYGADQDDCYPFPAMIGRAARHEKPFTVWGDGQQVRDFIHIDDIVAAVKVLCEEGVDGPVNLGTGTGTSMDELARLTMHAAGYQTPIAHSTDKPAGVEYRVADPTLLHRYHLPRVSIDEGVDRALHQLRVAA